MTQKLAEQLREWAKTLEEDHRHATRTENRGDKPYNRTRGIIAEMREVAGTPDQGSEPSDDVSQEYLPDDDYEPPLLGEGEIVISGPYKLSQRSTGRS